ncbi:MAG: sigma-70 family RNA polymerase sigma factor [Clostridia bacterium]|nr:sigma-70 family RNA polymerase sigma factor [Clostridia bacterium]
MKTDEIKKSDEELVSLYQNGDRQALDELMLRHSGLVRSCARGFFLVGGETEDLIQEGMIGLYHAIQDYKRGEDSSSFKNFAYLCVSRRIIDAVRSATNKKNAPAQYFLSALPYETAGSGLNPEDLLILEDERKAFSEEMSKALSDFEFKVTTMYVEGMSSREICDATGKTAKSVDNALQRSKRKLQQLLKK